MYLAVKCEYIMNLWKTKLFTQNISTNTFHTKVTLNYPGCAREFQATLGEDLQALGKALARQGTYKQIADAALHCPSLKTFLIKKTLQALGKECHDLCSKKTHLCYVRVDQMKWRTFRFKNSLKNGNREHPFFTPFLWHAQQSRKKVVTGHLP